MSGPNPPSLFSSGGPTHCAPPRLGGGQLGARILDADPHLPVQGLHSHQPQLTGGLRAWQGPKSQGISWS